MLKEKKRTGVVSVSVEESIKTPISRLTGIYVTYVEPGGPADLCGLKMHDKILQVNGYDFTLLTHERAVHYLKKNERLKMLVARAEVQEFP
ncbi:PDZ/DHR/GLGF domain protein [Trichuris suis]|nr:PDZ/DHR/GLGF domain protein [Trichuris suis]